MREVVAGVWLGDAQDAGDAPALARAGVARVLSLGPFGGSPETVARLVVEVEDSPDADILTHLPRCADFVAEGAARGVPTLVHCVAGVSRSATAVCAFLMSAGAVFVDPADCDADGGTALSARGALRIVRRASPGAEPNEGFMKQLEAWRKMGCPPAARMARITQYRRWRTQRQAMGLEARPGAGVGAGGCDADGADGASARGAVASVGSTAARAASGAARDQATGAAGASMGREARAESEARRDGVAEVAAEAEEVEQEADSAEKVKVEGALDAQSLASVGACTPGESSLDPAQAYLCRRCRRPLFAPSDVVSHERGDGQRAFRHVKRDRDRAAADAADVAACSHVFIDPPEWSPEVHRGDVEGKLRCPHCDYRLGAFSWHGAQCSCGAWVVPAFSIHANRVDPPSDLHAPSDAGGGAVEQGDPLASVVGTGAAAGSVRMAMPRPLGRTAAAPVTAVDPPRALPAIDGNADSAVAVGEDISARLEALLGD